MSRLLPVLPPRDSNPLTDPIRSIQLAYLPYFVRAFGPTEVVEFEHCERLATAILFAIDKEMPCNERKAALAAILFVIDDCRCLMNSAEYRQQYISKVRQMSQATAG